jgi:hypothetical protein
MVEGTIPHFEGRPVDATVVKMSGQVPLDEALNETVLGIDDAVQLVSMFRVVAVYHKVDDKTGNLTRVQVLKPIEAALKPIDESDPNDEGIVRALPYTPQGGGQ